MINLTDKAIEKIKKISDDEDIGFNTIRVKVIGNGCAGFEYDLFFDNQNLDQDNIFKFESVTVMVDPLSFQYVDGVTIDYVESLIGSGFRFNNPNSTATCGCGKSFSA